MPKTARILLSALLIASLTLVAMPVQPAYAATFTVSKTTDTNDGTCDADCSLREAIAAANAAAGADTITVPAGTYTLTEELLTTSDMTINGAGAGITIIQADAAPLTANYRVLRNNGGTVTISGVTIQNGQCTGSCAGAATFPTWGGGIFNQAGSLTLDASTVSSHYGHVGGGIANLGTLRIQNGSLITENEARFEGGGIYNQIGNTTTIDASTVSLNTALYGTGLPDGGGISNFGTLIIQNGSLIGGPGAANSAVRGGGIFNSGSTTVTDSTVNSNEATSNGGGIYNSGGTVTITGGEFSGNYASSSGNAQGGGIYNTGGTLIISGAEFSGNYVNASSSALAQGGGIYHNSGTLNITESVFSGNTANTVNTAGGGIYVNAGTATVTGSAFSDNSAGWGGGINNRHGGTVTVTNSTFSNNSALYGGGIWSDDIVTVTNSTFSNNSASIAGGGIWNYYAGRLTVTNSTFSGNSATTGGGVYTIGGGTAHLAGTIFAAGATGANCFNSGGTINDNGYNLSSDGTCANGNTGSANNATLDLNALADNGGPTKTHALGANSAALDAIPNGTTISNNTITWICNNTNTFTDQRGVSRPQGTACDIGAYESGPIIPIVTASNPSANAVLASLSSITVVFNQDMLDDATAKGAENISNYILVERGTNGAFDTTSCKGGVVSDDVQQTISTASYNSAGFVTSLTLANPLADGVYRLFVCGTTSVWSAAGLELNNGVNDYTVDFTISSGAGNGTGAATVTTTASALPNTGFAPNKVTTLPVQPAELAYAKLGDIVLEIPSLNVKSTIVGVPQNADDTWDVTWLGNDTGWLNGTAFPTWNGNSVLTAHVTNASGLEGPFAALKSLKYGDQIIVHLGGMKYIYEVRETKLARPYSTSYAFQSKQDASYLTLITCQFYNPLNENYLFRRVVRAVLIEVSE